jgi:hypothetical protein
MELNPREHGDSARRAGAGLRDVLGPAITPPDQVLGPVNKLLLEHFDRHPVLTIKITPRLQRI